MDKLQKSFLLSAFFAFITGVHPTSLYADVKILDFEGLADMAPLTNQYAGLGVTFQNAIALLAFPAGSLNTSDFPPFSGITVVADDGGPMSLFFSSAVSSVNARFTYNETITVAAFDAGGGAPLLSVSSDPGCAAGNFGSNGNAACQPNELLSLAAPSIRSVMITGNAGGGSFVMDDLTFNISGNVVIPEPSSVFLLAAVLAALTCTVRRTRHFSRNNG